MPNKRPVSVTIVAVLFLLTGLVGLLYHGSEFNLHGPFQYQLVGVLLVRSLAVLGGAFLLRGKNWARWLLVVWLGFHVVLSAFHSPSEVIVHGLLLAVIAYFLFRPPAAVYFRQASAPSDQSETDRGVR